ncbi:hypothetical protein [Plantactinospora sp. KBS50]|uniref:hypothetical protein n=1 Tax=Plantactinospora sp. KBS50 TaxID=2024580 RepID=UPI000BAACF81|nr:hypothetical protein [Plantactinospora sp. KBS50]ASW56687.1 hypothetical protein CIK06_24800 [Plantactinospora sp. KBS50]
MTLKWTAVLVAAVSITLCVTANIVTGTTDGTAAPDLVNLLAVATATGASVLAFVADLHERLNGRVTALTEFLVARLNDLDATVGDRNAGFVEGYLLGQGRDGAVVPISPRARGRKAMIGSDE